MLVTKEAYWRGQKRRIGILLAVWAVVGFGLAIFGAPWLNGFSLGGVPLGFWVAQQGAIFVFVALVWIFAWTSDRADRAAGLDETAETTASSSADH
jgi:putative solute:sodium symporter small subunit